MKKDYPILEFDRNPSAIIEPHKIIREMDIPKRAAMCFFQDVIVKLKSEGRLKLIYELRTEMGLHPVYEIEFKGEKLALYHPGIGAPLGIGLMEEVIALGATKFIACGGAGVLDKDISLGHVIVPVSAVRDEGTSYHYLPPSREVEPCQEGIEAIEKALHNNGCKYILAKTWTTDAFYRETPGKVRLRKSEGCLSVEMECAAFCAVARFRKVQFAQLLYGGDNVSCEAWDSRNWHETKDIREGLLMLALEALSYM